MSIPVSIHHGPFTTNTLASKKFLIVYISIIWCSIIPILLEFYFFWKLVEKNNFLLFLLFPIQIYFSYLQLVLISIILAKILLIIINFIHKPQEGIFERTKKNKDYYFWSLRAMVKKWPIWVSKFIPLPFMDKIIYKWFDNDSEFIDLGKNVIIGKGSSIKASIILGKYLMIKKVRIEENVIIGSNSFITPGTQIGKNTVIAAMSITRYNQKLEPFSIYIGIPAEKLEDKLFTSTKSLKNLESGISMIPYKKVNPRDLKNFKTQQGKFVKNYHYNLIIIIFIYFISYSLPIFGFLYYYYHFFVPYILETPNLIYIFKNVPSLHILLITPLLFIFLYMLNLLILILISKFIYNYIQHKNPIKEAFYHWNNKNKDYKNYFIRSFLLRYVKWKLQRSAFPWLLISGFNFIGNCKFGRKTIIDDSYIAKELLHVGKNTYLGKCLVANHLWDKILTIKSIKIEDNVVISDCCCIAPGSYIEKNVFMLPLSITTKNTKLKSNSIYLGAPLKSITRDDLFETLNVNLDNFK